jgi:hypothetical protein
MYFHQKSGQSATLPTPSLLLGFTAITDHPRVGEVPLGYGSQSGAAPVNISVSIQSRAVQNAGGHWVFSWFHPLDSSKWYDGAAPFLINFQNHSALEIHTYQIPGEVNLHLVKARSKLGEPRCD